MRTETTSTTAAATKPRTRKPALRVEQLAEVTETATSTTEPAGPAIDPEIAAKIAKEEERLKKVQAEAARRQARIDAYKTGKPIPPAGSKGLPPVVKMNELGALARQLHRSAELMRSDEVAALDDGPVSPKSLGDSIAKLRNEAMRRWTEQHAQRVAAGAADNDTLHPLGLAIDPETGAVSLVEKSPK